MSKDQPITLQRNNRTPDLSGGWTDSWEDLEDVWAEVVAKAGRESLDQGRVNASFVNLFTIYQTDLTEADRIMWNGETWNIRGIRRNGERKLDWVVEAERGVAS